MDYKLVPSVCSYCGTGCGVLFKVMNGRLVGTLPLKTHPVNEGKLCIKGWNLHEYVNHPLRLKAPLIKINGRFRKVSWDQALEFTAQRFQEIRDRYGPESLGVLVSAKITNEENDLAQKFARVVWGTNNIVHCARV
jgi:formate dehydrogenase major subunit